MTLEAAFCNLVLINSELGQYLLRQVCGKWLYLNTKLQGLTVEFYLDKLKFDLDNIISIEIVYSFVRCVCIVRC